MRVRTSAPIDPNDRLAGQIKALQQQVAELQRRSIDSAEFTPTWSGLNQGTGGNASNTGRYTYANGLLIASGKLVYGNTGRTFPSAATRLHLPDGFEAVRHSSANTLDHQVGFAAYRDASAAISWIGIMWLTSTTELRPLITNVAGTHPVSETISSTSPFTFTNDDSIVWQYVVPAVRA